MTLFMGEDWQTQMQRHLPGSVAQMQRDAATWFASACSTPRPYGTIMRWRWTKAASASAIAAAWLMARE